ncbi:hypothetical protein KSF_002610 [Reticulibacter mediterranei]|uniref:Uncharacterized protein n=1 Tax=Reticulibacter mediterranei TaxID=2778369 RepID=A0A8J3IAV5_9CHLR|nr:hypothetical protein [Reticulibacter mediterranei]GHO90213.1 hypothetical protein KSF_002610 [Reticulibacter mediterranei]
MDNIRRIHVPRLWLISGFLTLLLVLAAFLLLPTSSTQAASVQGCKDKGATESVKGSKTTQDCTTQGAKGPKTTVICTTGGAKGKDINGPVTIGTNAQTQSASSKDKGCTCAVQAATGKDTKGKITTGQGCNCTTTAEKDNKKGKTTATCTVGKKHP